jgi:methylated-DNA-protein-cysteine methyltransferase-like protein
LTQITPVAIIPPVHISPEAQSLFPRIYEVVKQVPWGRVTTYGAVAQVVGPGCDARLVGYAMAGVNDPDVPWQRVINAKGAISPRAGRGAEIQRKRLEAEGVAFDERGRIDFERFGWRGPDPDWAAQHGFYTLPPTEQSPSQSSMFD